MMQRNHWFLIALILAVACGVFVLAERYFSSAFTIDHTQPFWIEFGRGSGMYGLDTVKIDQTGRTILHRLKVDRNGNVARHSWEAAALQLPPDMLAEVLKAVETNDLMSLNKEYHENILDGDQWVLWIKQGWREKSVYFNNNFPPQIKSFAEQLDAILTRAGSEKVVWQPVPRSESREHERELWESIRR